MAGEQEEQSSNPSGSSPPQRQQGVLWKRRDVFKNRWRPRWFVLQPQEAVLTYYLLSKREAAATSSIVATPLRRSRSTGNNNNNNNGSANDERDHTPSFRSAISDITNATATATPNRNNNNNNSQGGGEDATTTNSTSVISEDPVDYDVVPRGAIYLAGCQVSINHSLSRPEEGLFAFTVVPPQSEENEIHLAARTEQARAVWVQRLEEACASASTRSTSRHGGGGDDDSASTSSNHHAWKSVSPTETLFDNVPHALAAKIEQSLETYLELAEEQGNENNNNRTALSWSPIFQDRDGVSAFTRQDLQGRTLMKSTAIIPHHPKQVANLLLDSARRPDFEDNVSKSERLEVLNPFTFLDYYAYKAVWPTSPRDFAVVLHWQVLHRSMDDSSNSNNNEDNDSDNDKEQAIATLAFSCPEADELSDSQQHVRAKLHASFYLLRLITEGGGEGGTPLTSKCHVTRILSYNLGGSLPRNLTTTVLMQQAGIPGVLARHLSEVEPTPPERLSTNADGGPMTNETVIRDVVEDLLQEADYALQSGARRTLSFDRGVNEKVAGMGSAPSPDDAVPPVAQSSAGLSILSTALILLAPLVVYHFTVTADISSLLADEFECASSGAEMLYWFLHPSLLFCITSFLAARYAVLQSLGKPVAPPRLAGTTRQGVVPITCSFSVDLKGVLRFINMKKEEKRESTPKQNIHAEISVVHIVATALARAMKNHTECWNYERVTVPLLGIDGYFRYASSALDLSVSSGDRIVTLEDFEYNNVQAVATDLLAAERKLQCPKRSGWLSSLMQNLCKFLPLGDGEHQRHGRCMILLTHTDSETVNQRSTSSDSVGVEITPGNLPEDLDVLVVVGGVRLIRSAATLATGSPLKAPPPKPMLSLTVTINTPSLLDTGKCNAFAEELQKLVQFPELCDNE